MIIGSRWRHADARRLVIFFFLGLALVFLALGSEFIGLQNPPRAMLQIGIVALVVLMAGNICLEVPLHRFESISWFYIFLIVLAMSGRYPYFNWTSLGFLFILNELVRRLGIKDLTFITIIFSVGFLVISLIPIGKILYEQMAEMGSLRGYYGTYLLHSEYGALPRSTGVSRTVGVCLVIGSCYLMQNFNFLRHVTKILLCSFLVILVVLMILLGSRGSILCTLVSLGALVFWKFGNVYSYRRIKIKKFLVLFAVCALGLFYALVEVRYESVTNVFDSSGRIRLWTEISGLFYHGHAPSFAYLFGLGGLFDRDLLSISLSNAYLYSLTAGGLVGSLALLIFLVSKFLSAFKISSAIERSDHSIVAVGQLSGCLLLLFFCVRGLFENSFLVFGVDTIWVLFAIRLLSKSQPKE